MDIYSCLAGSGGYAYAINRKAAKNLIRAQIPIKIEMDAWEIYLKFGFISLYCLSEDVIKMNESLDSVIDSIEKRNNQNKEEQTRKKNIKEINVCQWYYDLTPMNKLKYQLRRLLRHIQELYYIKD